MGIVNLDNAGDIKKSARKRKNCFEITTPSRVYFMCAESPSALEDWIRELTAERDRIQGKRKLTVDAVRKKIKEILRNCNFLNFKFFLSLVPLFPNLLLVNLKKLLWKILNY